MVHGRGQPTRWFRPSLTVPVLVLALLAGWWGVLLPRAEQSVFARVPVLDEVYYLDRALDPAPPDQGFFVSPLYPRLIALAGSAVSLPDGTLADPARLRGIRLLQITCWLAVALLLHDIMRRTPPTAGDFPRLHSWLIWVPTLLFLLYRPAVVFTLSVLLEMPLVFLVTLFLWWLVAFQRQPWMLLVSGLILGMAGLLRGSVLVLVLVPLMLLWSEGGTLRRRAGLTLLLILAVGLPLLPDALTNMRQARRLTGPTLNAGVNLYIGNGPEANGFYVAAVPGDWRRDPAGTSFLAERLGRPEVSLAQADSIWSAAAFDNIRRQPGRTLLLWAKKVWLHLQGWEIDQLTPQDGWLREVPLLRAHFLPYALILALAVAGILAGGMEARLKMILLTCLALLVATQSVFFVVSRYRLILVPFLCLLAGLGLARLVISFRQGAEMRIRWVLGFVLALLVAYPWGMGDVRARWLPLAQANEARRWAVVGQAYGDRPALQQSADLYRKAVAAEPKNPGPWLGLAVTLESLDEREEARQILQQALLRVDDDLALRRMLVGSLLADGLRSDALAQAQSLLQRYPEDAETLHNSAVLLASFGNEKAALEMAQRLIAVQPDDPRGYLDLGVLLARTGRREEAATAFRRGLERNPFHPDLQKNLDLLTR